MLTTFTGINQIEQTFQNQICFLCCSWCKCSRYDLYETSTSSWFPVNIFTTVDCLMINLTTAATIAKRQRRQDAFEDSTILDLARMIVAFNFCLLLFTSSLLKNAMSSDEGQDFL